MKFYIVLLLVSIGYFVFLSSCNKISSVNNSPISIEEIKVIVDKYCAYIANEEYQLAYDEYLNTRYKKDITLDKFVFYHKERMKKLGPLLEKKMVFNIKTNNIFSGLREYQLTYELRYTNVTQSEIIKLNDEDGKFLIEGTYTRSASDTLRFMVW